MNNQLSKGITIAAKVFAVVLIVGIISGIVEACFGIGKSIFDKEEEPKTSVTQQISGSSQVNDEAKIVLDLRATEVNVTLGDEFSYNTDNEYIRVKNDGNFIEIIEKEHRTTDITHLNIVLPRDTVFATFDLDAGAGNITVEGLKCRNADIDLGAGNVVFDSLEVSGYADIDAGAGQLTVKDGSVNNLDFDMGMGETAITSLLTGNSSLDCGVGNLELNVKASYENYTVDVEKGLGAVNINNQRVSSDSVLGSGPDKLEISGGLGNVTVTFEN